MKLRQQGMTQIYFNPFDKTMKTLIRHCFLSILLGSQLLTLQNAVAEDIDSSKNYSSVEERRIDSSILQERANIRKEREEIAMRKKELKTIEEGVDKKLTQIDSKLEELRNLQKKIETLLAGKSVKEKKRVQELAGIYQKMNPAKAALVISGLDKQLASDLLANMKVKSAAKILDQISKQKATQLSTTFTTIQLE